MSRKASLAGVWCNSRPENIREVVDTWVRGACRIHWGGCRLQGPLNMPIGQIVDFGPWTSAQPNGLLHGWVMELYLHLDVLTMVLVTGNNQPICSCREVSYPLTTHLFQR